MLWCVVGWGKNICTLWGNRDKKKEPYKVIESPAQDVLVVR